MHAKTMNNKVCLVTGATNGIGLATATALAGQGATVIAHGRNRTKGEHIVQEIIRTTGNKAVRFAQADFTSLAQVRALASELNAQLPRLDVLVNNAALTASRRKLTVDGHESVFAANHLAPFLLTNLLLDKLKVSAPARIVVVSSAGHRAARLDLDDLTSERKFGVMTVYGNSKLGNILLVRTLSQRLNGTGVTINALHPGLVRTNLGDEGGTWMNLLLKASTFFMLSPEQGASTSVYLATSPEVEGHSGDYYYKCKPAPVSEEARDDALAERLWSKSCQLVGLHP